MALSPCLPHHRPVFSESQCISDQKPDRAKVSISFVALRKYLQNFCINIFMVYTYFLWLVKYEAKPIMPHVAACLRPKACSASASAQRLLDKLVAAAAASAAAD